MARFLWSPRIYFLFSSPVLILLPEHEFHVYSVLETTVEIGFLWQCLVWLTICLRKQTCEQRMTRCHRNWIKKKTPGETKELQRKIHHPYWGSRTKLDQLGDLCSVPQRINSYPLNTEGYKTSFWPRTKERKFRNIIWEKVFWDPQIICYLHIMMLTTHNDGPCDEHL